MGPIFHASWNLPEMLDLWGYGTRPASRVSSDEKPNRAKVNPWRILKMVVPGPIQYFIKDHLPKFAQDQLLFLWYRGGKNWKGCRAFSIPNNDSVGAIRVSVKGRDRDGVVEPDGLPGSLSRHRECTLRTTETKKAAGLSSSK